MNVYQSSTTRYTLVDSEYELPVRKYHQFLSCYTIHQLINVPKCEHLHLVDTLLVLIYNPPNDLYKYILQAVDCLPNLVEIRVLHNTWSTQRECLNEEQCEQYAEVLRYRPYITMLSIISHVDLDIIKEMFKDTYITRFEVSRCALEHCCNDHSRYKIELPPIDQREYRLMSRTKNAMKR